VHFSPRKALKKGYVTHPTFFNFLIREFLSDGKSDENREMMGNLKVDDIQKLHTTAPEQLTDQELLLSTISAVDLVRKHSGVWDKEHQRFAALQYGEHER
jgi:hypothetical protein